MMRISKKYVWMGVCTVLFFALFVYGMPANAQIQGSAISPQNRVPAPGRALSNEGGLSLSSSGGDPATFGAGLNEVKQVASQNKLSEARSAKDILQTIVKWLLSLIGTLAVISLLYGGFLYITSQGDESKAERAKTIILYSIIGLVVIGLSAIIVNVVISVTS